VHGSGVPAALNIMETTRYPLEGVGIGELFPNILGFASSGGSQNANFYSVGVVPAQGHDVAAPLLPAVEAADTSCAVPGTSGNAAASCAALLAAGQTTSGVYWIDPDGGGGTAAFQAYCDQVTDGGGWMQTVYVHTSVTSAHNLAVQEIAVHGRAMKTFTTDAVNRPVAPNGLMNTYNQVLFRGGNSTWQSTMGAWVRFSAFPQGSTSVATVYSGVLTANGRTAAYHQGRGWGRLSMTVTTEFALWDASGVSPICGGDFTPRGRNCPFFNSNQASYPYHYDTGSVPRQLFVR
jgi:hypothetical protein